MIHTNAIKLWTLIKNNIPGIFRKAYKTAAKPEFVVFCAPVVGFSAIIFNMKTLYWGTASLQFIPWRALAWDYIQNATFPFWNPLSGLGAPLMANYQVAIFYPPNWISFLFDVFGGVPWMAWSQTLLITLHLCWAGLGMVRLARQIGLTPISQTIAGITFSLGGFFVTRAGFFSLIAAASWLPWLIYFSERILHAGICTEQKPYQSMLLFCLSSTLMLLSGHAQITWYSFLLLVVWFLFRLMTNSKMVSRTKPLFLFMSALGIAVLISSIQLLPTLEYLIQSQRSETVSYDNAVTYSFWPWRILTLWAPNLFGNPANGDYWGYASYWEDAIYIGFLPILFAISTFRYNFISRKGRWKRPVVQNQKLIRFLWGALLISFVFALGKFTPIFPYLFKYVPTFNMFNAPSRFLVLGCFSLSMLAGIGFDLSKKPEGRALYWTRLLTAGALSFIIGAVLLTQISIEITDTIIDSFVIMGFMGCISGIIFLTKPQEDKSTRTNYWGIGVILFILADLIVTYWNFNPSVDISLFKESNNQNGLKNSLNNARIYLDESDHYDIKFNRFLRFDDFNSIEPANNLRRVLLPNLNILDGIQSANNFDPFVPARFSFWMAGLQTFPPQIQNKLLGDMNVKFVEKKDLRSEIGVSFEEIIPKGRFQWAGCNINVADEKAAWDKVIRLDRVTNWVILEGDPKILDTQCENQIRPEINILSESPDSLEISIITTHAGWFIIADSWYPGWEARVDGQITEIYHANYLFKAVYISPGSHNLAMRYNPYSFKIGLILSLCGSCIFLVFLKRVMR